MLYEVITAKKRVAGPQMVIVLVHQVGLNSRVQWLATVVDIGAEIGIHIAGVHKGRAVVTGKTQAELLHS